VDTAGGVRGTGVRHVAGTSSVAGLARGLKIADDRSTAYEMVRDTLRHAILIGHLPGGTRLLQAQIAAQLNVSNTPVREALRELASVELVSFRARQGAFVREPDVAELREIYRIRTALEPSAIRLATPRVTRAQLEEASDLRAEMEKERDPVAWTETNWRFHATLESAAESPRLASIVGGLRNSATLSVSLAMHRDPERIQRANEEHDHLLAAMRGGDAQRADEILRHHLEASLRAILAPAAPDDAGDERVTDS